MDIKTYNVRKRSGIGGWFFLVDAELFRVILETQLAQSMGGSVVEIGVHHGKSFIPLALSNGGKNCYAIDLFADQDKNIDRSGRGDRAVFETNLKSVGLDPTQLVIDQRVSSDVSAEDIVSRVGKARFFHIDGGHNLEAVANDIDVAIKSCDDHGVIAIDDVFRPEWPDVSQAVYGKQALFKAGFVQFAFGFNKAFYCSAGHVGVYQSTLMDNSYLARSLNKTYEHNGQKTLVFNVLPLPDWSFWRMLKWYLHNRYLNGPAQFKKKRRVDL